MNLGARTAMWSGGAKFPTARDYVQDGLEGLWDGIENAGWGIHDSNATTWVDLTGKFTNTITIGSGGWTANSKVSNGNNALYLLGRNSYHSYEVVFKEVQENEQKNKYLKLGRYGSSYRISGSPNIYLNGNTAYEYPVIEIGKIYSFGDDYNLKPYMNGVRLNKISAVVPSYSGETDAQKFLINIIGEIYCVRRYARHLTDEEIAHNYAIDKARFGLT